MNDLSRIHICPQCGHQDDLRKLRSWDAYTFDVDERIFSIQNYPGTFFLPRSSGLYLLGMLRASGRTCSKAHLLDYVYGDKAGDPPEIKIVDVMVCKLRAELKTLAPIVETIWGLGYRLRPWEEAKRIINSRSPNAA